MWGDIIQIARDVDASGHVTKAQRRRVDMKSIPLTQGKFAIVDDGDYEYLNQFKWWVSDGGYAVRTQWLPSKKIKMHREIMNTPEDMITDHINGNKLDNRRENLRVCNKSQNAANAKTYNTNKSQARGVSLHKQSGKWRASITVSRKNIHLGLYETVEEASRAYINAANKHFGDFARKDNND